MSENLDRKRLLIQQLNTLGLQPLPLSDVETLLDFIRTEGGMLSIVADPPDLQRRPDGSWEYSVGLVFGQEAPDSDMPGGASYAVENTSIEDCLTKVVKELNL
jgi:hypothetical protein